MITIRTAVGSVVRTGQFVHMYAVLKDERTVAWCFSKREAELIADRMRAMVAS